VHTLVRCLIELVSSVAVGYSVRVRSMRPRTEDALVLAAHVADAMLPSLHTLTVHTEGLDKPSGKGPPPPPTCEMLLVLNPMSADDVETLVGTGCAPATNPFGLAFKAQLLPPPTPPPRGALRIARPSARIHPAPVMPPPLPLLPVEIAAERASDAPDAPSVPQAEIELNAPAGAESGSHDR
jgi:hypothetical protein